MARKGIREYDAKRMLSTALSDYDGRVVLVGPEDNLEDLAEQHPWLKTEKLVAKPDQLFGKRGKNGLVLLNKDLAETSAWIKELQGKKKKLLNGVEGTLTHFIVEPFKELDGDFEYYLCIEMFAEHDVIRLSNKGGVDVEENWDSVKESYVDPLKGYDSSIIEAAVNELYPEEQREAIIKFVGEVYKHYEEGGYTYLEINPFSFSGGKVLPLDMVAKLDDTAEFECRHIWGDLTFPAPFGQNLTPEEKLIRDVDAKTGASLKLRLLNPKGRVWNMVAGGGASVIYADTVCDLGYAEELAMYGEYSGNPNTQNTYIYAKTVIDLMTREKDPQGRPKFLLIGGGIANFTDVAKTFTGIIMAFEEYAEKMKEVDVRIFVRRGGPNYKEGLAKIEKAAKDLGLPIEVHGPETHMTQIVADALALA